VIADNGLDRMDMKSNSKTGSNDSKTGSSDPKQDQGMW